MIEIFNRRTGEKLGMLTEEQLDFLVDNFEVDVDEEPRYLLNKAFLTDLKTRGAPSDLVEIIQRVLEGKREVELEYHIADEDDINYDEE